MEFKIYLIVILLLIPFLVYFIIQGRKTKHSFPDFFNGGENIHWTAIAMSILAMNFNFEYIMSSAANGFHTGFALAAYEWTAIVVIIFTSLYIFPHFLRLGVLTLPEYLEHKFDKKARVMMSVLFLIATFVLAILALTTSSIFLEKLFNIHRLFSICVLTLIGATVMFAGGATSRIKISYILFIFFMFVGALLLMFCIIESGGIDNIVQLADGRMEVILPADSPVMPWTSVFLGPVWVLHLNYWAFYPAICHPSLAQKTLSQTQKAFLLVATAKIVLPVILILPGIVGYELYRDQITNPELTLAVVIQNVVPIKLTWLIALGYLATLFTTFTIVLNTATTMFTLDIYGTIFRNRTSNEGLIRMAKVFIIMFSVAAILGAYHFEPTESFFRYATIMLELAAPLSASVFISAIYTNRTRPIAAHLAIIAGIPIFLFLKLYFNLSTINVAGIEFVILTALILAIRFLFPLPEPVVLKEKYEIKFERNLMVAIWSIFLLTIATSIYAVMI